MYNQTPPTSARSISPNKHPISSSPSSINSNLRAEYYTYAAAMYGQAQCHIARQKEEKVVPEDSATAQVSPIHGITNSFKVLALVH